VVLWVALLFIVVGSIFAGIVFRSIEAIKDTANRIDDERAVDATAAAVDALRTQLFGILHDNATWDGAYKQLNSINRKYWVIENWATTGSDNPAYDTAIVTDARGKIIVAYKDGQELTEPPSVFFGNHFDTIIQRAETAGDQSGSMPVYAVRSKSGVALIAASKIRPTSTTTRIEERNLYTLVMARHLTAPVIEGLSKSFRIDQLKLSLVHVPEQLEVPLNDLSGVPIAYLSWPSKLPGSLSFLTVQGQLFVGGAILVVFLFGIGVAGFVAVRKLRQDEATARHAALHDPLTGLWNRRALMEHLADLARYRDERVVELCLLDLDGFKRVNDSWGHAAGDELIADVAARLVDMVPPGAFIARLGGDEFSIVTQSDPASARREEATSATAVLSAASGILQLGSRQIQVAGSVGRATARSMDLDIGNLMRAADVALYHAKDLGRGRVVTFDGDLDRQRRDSLMMEEHLRVTLAGPGIEVVYQPLISATDQKICGVEALARWTGSPLGRVPPDVFIPVAEKAGMIDLLGLQVLRQALAATGRWPGIGVCVNVSPVQLQDHGFADKVAAIMAEAAFDPARLTLEITEGVLISHPEQAMQAIVALRALGVGIALDDFGSGFASIGTLRAFAFDRVKVDKSLVAALDAQESAAPVLQATIALANAMEISVTVEGIETDLHAQAALLYGCDVLQGYLYSKPLSEGDLTQRYFGATDLATSKPGREILH
jgi:diguanylate cyclase (GGDEF)-like protein